MYDAAPEASMFADNPLFDALNTIASAYRRGDLDHHTQIVTALGIHGIERREDGEGDEYLAVGFMLPGDGDFFAEIDSETYGTLYAIRIYRSLD